MREQLSRDELDRLDRLAEQGEALKQQVGKYLDLVGRLPNVDDPGDAGSFLARCAIERAEAAAVSMADKLRGVHGDRPTGDRVPTPQPRSPFIPPPPDVEHVAGRMSKGGKTEVYTGIMLRSPDTKTYHALRTFGDGKGERSICGMVKKGKRTGEAPIRDLEVLKCEPCRRCFSDEAIPLNLTEQKVQAKSRVAAWSQEYVRINQQLQEQEQEEETNHE